MLSSKSLAGEAHTHTEMKSVQLSHLERYYTSKDTGNYNGSTNIYKYEVTILYQFKHGLVCSYTWCHTFFIVYVLHIYQEK